MKTLGHTSFQTLQVLSDLRSVGAKGFGALSAQLKPSSKQSLRRIIFDQKCCLGRDDMQSLHGQLLFVAALPDRDHDAFLTATAVLLADRLQKGAGTDDLRWNWTSFQNEYRAGPSPIRAAIMQGFRCADLLFGMKLEKPPLPQDLFTYDGDDLRRVLRNTARAMPGETRDAICGAANKDVIPVHRHALDNCLKTSCVLSEFGNWFPREVVEKASLNCEHAGHAGATSLMLLDAIETRDAEEKMAFRWQEQSRTFLKLSPEWRIPIVAGIRHLYEMSFDWQPYGGWGADQLAEKAVVVPFAKA